LQSITSLTIKTKQNEKNLQSMDGN